MNQHLTDPLQWIGASGVSPGRYERPQGITFDLEGRIIICDTKQKRIQILHPNGRGFDFYMAYSGNKNNFSVSTLFENTFQKKSFKGSTEWASLCHENDNKTVL